MSGKVMKKAIGSYSYVKWDSICEVTLYPLKVTEIYDEWDEAHFRKRRWINAKRAVKKVEPKELSNLIKKFLKNSNGIDLIEM